MIYFGKAKGENTLVKNTDRIKNLKADTPDVSGIIYNEGKLEKALKLSSDELIAEAIRDILMRDEIDDDIKNYRYDKLS